jgi:hypothetical protein
LSGKSLIFFSVEVKYIVDNANVIDLIVEVSDQSIKVISFYNCLINGILNFSGDCSSVLSKISGTLFSFCLSKLIS